MTVSVIIGLLFALAIITWGVLIALALLGVVESDAAFLGAVGAMLLKILDSGVNALKTKRGGPRPEPEPTEPDEDDGETAAVKATE